MDAAVIEVLRQAVSQDPNVLKSAEQTLKQWEIQQGFYIALYVSYYVINENLLYKSIIMFSMHVLNLWNIA